MLLAPREVCASAVRTADPANSSAIARVSVTLRIRSLLGLGLSGCAPLVVPNGGILPSLLFWSTAQNRRRCAWARSLAFGLPCRFEPFMLSKVWRRLCDLTAGKTCPCDVLQGRRRYDARLRHRPQLDRCRTLMRLPLPVISYACFCEISAGPSTGTTKAAQPGPGENPPSKREKPRPWQVRGSRAEALPRFWPIVMLHRNAACVLRATASSLKPI